MYGLGASLAYTPSLAILGHYFKKYLGLVNGIVTAGSSVFTAVIPFLMEYLLRRIGLEGTLRSLAALTAIVMACAVLFKPIPRKLPSKLANICGRFYLHLYLFLYDDIYKMSYEDYHIKFMKMASSFVTLKIKYVHRFYIIMRDCIVFITYLEID